MSNSNQLIQRLLAWCVYDGPHPNENGFLLMFRFPNGLQATVVKTDWSKGIEVGVSTPEWLIDVIDDLTPEQVPSKLEAIMKRSLA